MGKIFKFFIIMMLASVVGIIYAIITQNLVLDLVFWGLSYIFAFAAIIFLAYDIIKIIKNSM